MSFEDEWGRARQQAEARAKMRLNGTGGGTSAADLTVRRNDLGAVGNEAYKLHTSMAENGGHAKQASALAATALTQNNFVSGTALRKVNENWVTQMDTLLEACARISNHLDYTKAAHAKDEQDIQGNFASVSKITEYWK